MTISTIGFIIGNLIFASITNYLIKAWTLSNELWMLAVALAAQMVAFVLLAYLVRIGGLAITMSGIFVATLLVTVAIGVFVFGEKVSTTQSIGIILALVSIILLIFPS